MLDACAPLGFEVPEIAQIDYSHPLASSLRFCPVPISGIGAANAYRVLDLATGQYSTGVGTSQRTVYGVCPSGVTFNADKNGQPQSGAASFIWWHYHTDALAGQKTLLLCTSLSDGYGIRANGSTLELRFGNGVGTVTLTSVASAIAGERFLALGGTITWAVGAVAGAVFVNGLKRGSGSSASSLALPTSGWTVGHGANFFGFGMCFDRALQDSEMADLMMNPQQMFRRSSHSRWLAALG